MDIYFYALYSLRRRGATIMQPPQLQRRQEPRRRPPPRPRRPPLYTGSDTTPRPPPPSRNTRGPTSTARLTSQSTCFFRNTNASFRGNDRLNSLIIFQGPPGAFKHDLCEDTAAKDERQLVRFRQGNSG